MSIGTPTFDELIAPLSRADFLSALRERKITLLRGSTAKRFAKQIGWSALRALIMRGDCPTDPKLFRVTKESTHVPESEWKKMT